MSPRLAGPWASGLLLLSAGCGWLHQTRGIEVPGGTMPGAYALSEEETGAGAADSSGVWWEAFESPELDGAMDRARHENPVVVVMRHRAYEETVDADTPRGELYPRLSARLGYRNGRFLVASDTVDGQQLTAELSADYEVDVFGRVHRTRASANVRNAIARDEVDEALASALHDVARQWLSIVSLRQRRDVLVSTHERWEVFESELSQRLAAGLATPLDVSRVERERHALRARFEELDAELAVREHELAFLLGRERYGPGDADRRLPDVPAFPHVGVPVDLIERRPDLRRARHRMLEADHRLASAYAAYLPRVALSATAGLDTFHPRQFVDSPVWSAGVTVTAPLFDGGVTWAESDRMQGVVRRRADMYRIRFMAAMHEVVSSVRAERSLVEARSVAESAAESGRRLREQAKERFGAGNASFEEVLDSERVALEDELRFIDLSLAALLARVDLYAALGGDWTRDVAGEADR